MELKKPGYDLSSMSLLFIAVDGGEQFVCSITPEQLDPDNWLSLDEARMLDLFREKEDEIKTAVARIIREARSKGILHRPGIKNEPLQVVLS